MTLREMAVEYRQNVAVLRERLLLLRAELRHCDNEVQRLSLNRRIRDLTSLCREGRETARIMERYYERRERHGRPQSTGTGTKLSQ